MKSGSVEYFSCWNSQTLNFLVVVHTAGLIYPLIIYIHEAVFIAAAQPQSCGDETPVRVWLGGHGLINNIDTKAKCCHLKKFYLQKGLCGRCLSEFIDWIYSQSCWYFRLCPSNLLSGSNLPPPPSLCVSTLHKYRRLGEEASDRQTPAFTGQFFR